MTIDLTSPETPRPTPLQAAVERLRARDDDEWPGMLTIGETIFTTQLENA